MCRSSRRHELGTIRSSGGVVSLFDQGLTHRHREGVYGPHHVQALILPCVRNSLNTDISESKLSPT